MRILARIAAALACLFAPPVAAQMAAPAVRATPPLPTDKTNIWVLDLSTGGRVTVLLRPDVAPKMVERVKTLTRQRFYDGLPFHRVIDGFMAQGGDPKGDGTGGSPLPNLEAEFNYLPHVRGAVSAARADDKNSANSQFFIVFQPKLNLDKKYTVFGRVIDGMQWVDAIERGEPPANPSRILNAFVLADNPPPFRAQPAALPAPEVFAVAPRELARSVTLKQTVHLIRVVVGVIEGEVPQLAAPGDRARLAEQVLRYSREIAFAAAEVYAAAAEARGAWDARVEAGVVEALVRGKVAPKEREHFLGYAEVRRVFDITKVGKVAGCMITEGLVKRGAGVRLLRDGVVIHTGELSQLKRFKDDVREVARGYECGLSFAGFNDLREGDMVECYETELVPA